MGGGGKEDESSHLDTPFFLLSFCGFPTIWIEDFACLGRTQVVYLYVREFEKAIRCMLQSFRNDVKGMF